MRMFSLILIIILFIGCSTPKFEYENDGYSANADTEKKFLDNLGGVNDNFSVIIFTNGFLKKEKIEVSINDDIVFSDVLETDRSFGLAKTLKINNKNDIFIKNLSTGYSFKLSSKKNVKYKYIYISKDADTDTDYIINYSNKLQSFY